MKNHISSILATILAAVAVSCTDAGTYEFASLYEGLQFDMPRVERPQIPSRNVCITDFGGVGDGLTLNTKAFADAIDNLVSLGGGRITVPEGMWLSGPITLKSGIELHLEKNAVLMFDPDMDLCSVNYLSAWLMRQAGLSISPYQEFLLRLRGEVPVICAGCWIGEDGRYHEISDREGVGGEMLTAYQILQYNHLTDLSGRVSGLFTTGAS